MHLTHLKSFMAVVRCQNISRAADELHLTQPAVTKHIQALENHYARLLFERVGREVLPTEDGQVLFRHAKEVFRILDSLELAMAEAGHVIRGPLVLGASTIPGQYILPYLIAGFRKAYPCIDLHLEIAASDQIAAKVSSNQVNAGIVGSPVKDHRIVSRPFLEDDLVVIMPPGSPLASQHEIVARDLLHQPLVWREAGSGTRRVIEERLAGAGVDLEQDQKVLEVGTTEAVVAAVEAGLGVSIVSRWAVKKAVSLHAVVARSFADLPLRRKLYVIYPKHGALRAAQAFVDFLQSSGAQDTLREISSRLSEN